MSLSKAFLRLWPAYRRLEAERNTFKSERNALREEFERYRAANVEPPYYPAGHFYSPLPSRAEVAEAFARGGFGPPFPGIDLNEEQQFARLERFAQWYADQPFSDDPTPRGRFYLNNPSYGHYDAIMLYGMMREAQPRRIIEVGSGFSSAAMLDVNEQRLDNRIEFTFIDPEMKRLRDLLRGDEAMRLNLIEKRVQEVPLDIFATLQENDILFIDSSHVSKIGSDVNRIYFDILPVLAPGVLIHIHDVAGNLEYPKDWFEDGRAWNEQYLLRAFLMYNTAYRIELFTAWLSDRKHDFLRQKMPSCARGGGGQMWLRKLR